MLLDDKETVCWAAVQLWQFLIQQKWSLMQELLIIEPPTKPSSSSLLTSMMSGGFMMKKETHHHHHNSSSSSSINSSNHSHSSSSSVQRVNLFHHGMDQLLSIDSVEASSPAWSAFSSWLTSHFPLLHEVLPARTNLMYHHLLERLEHSVVIRRQQEKGPKHRPANENHPSCHKKSPFHEKREKSPSARSCSSTISPSSSSSLSSPFTPPLPNPPHFAHCKENAIVDTAVTVVDLTIHIPSIAETSSFAMTSVPDTIMKTMGQQRPHLDLESHHSPPPPPPYHHHHLPTSATFGSLSSTRQSPSRTTTKHHRHEDKEAQDMDFTLELKDSLVDFDLDLYRLAPSAQELVAQERQRHLDEIESMQEAMIEWNYWRARKRSEKNISPALVTAVTVAAAAEKNAMPMHKPQDRYGNQGNETGMTQVSRIETTTGTATIPPIVMTWSVYQDMINMPTWKRPLAKTKLVLDTIEGPCRMRMRLKWQENQHDDDPDQDQVACLSSSLSCTSSSSLHQTLRVHPRIQPTTVAMAMPTNVSTLATATTDVGYVSPNIVVDAPLNMMIRRSVRARPLKTVNMFFQWQLQLDFHDMVQIFRDVTKKHERRESTGLPSVTVVPPDGPKQTQRQNDIRTYQETSRQDLGLLRGNDSYVHRKRSMNHIQLCPLGYLSSIIHVHACNHDEMKMTEIASCCLYG
jgi:hypothetical protein